MSGFPFRLALATTAVGLLSAAGCATAPQPAKTSPTAAASTTRGRQATRCIDRRESTRHQREVAEANARRLYFSKRSKRQAALRKHRTRLIAVQTVRNTDSTGEASCMLFDLQNEKLVDTLVYDCDRVPQVGESVKFATHIATYVGG